ncbi:MAG: hypothetical protein E7536_05620 [Ruminococcaceae bacterium]|nr:hypothetical protein [Oscillospiraceae bacterium]
MQLEFRNKKFKIMQVADTQEGKRVSPDLLNLLNAAMEEEKPDLVVYSGDQIWNIASFKGNRKIVHDVLYKITEPAHSRNVPFTICFGNHDRQVGLSNEEQFEIYKTIPNFVGESAENVDGCANHVIEIKKGDEIVFLLYCIDSHTSLKIGYDHVHENQIEWYRKTRDEYKEKTGKYIPSIVIQHIPVPEVDQLMLEVKKGTKGAVQGFRNRAGKWYVLDEKKVNKGAFMKESPADPMENGGQFDAMAEKGDVKGIYFGHDHINSFNGNVRGIDVGYTQGAGFHIYGPGLDRGVRIISLDSDGTFETYDRRYRDLVGRKVKEKLRFAMYQVMPTNVYEAFYRLIKVFGVAAAIAIIVLIIKQFK